jgi:hydroxypyruvate reductase
LSGAGANIQQLNTVRKQLSRVKGGRLARACGAAHLISLIISDVLGDPLDVIASGPTVPDTSTPQQALQVLEQFGARQAGIRQAVFDYLEQAAGGASAAGADAQSHVTNLIIGNNATAVVAAVAEATRRGYATAQQAVDRLEGAAEEVGRNLATQAMELRSQSGKRCLVSGGEPTVRLVEAEQRGLGGRNQQLALAALEHLQKVACGDPPTALDSIALLSGGTDGEDGPTDAAGAVIDAALARVAEDRKLNPADYLARNDAYHFFDPLGGLIKTGPTHTNVCDLRVVVTQPTSQWERSESRLVAQQRCRKEKS